METELRPINDSRKSFYRKAIVKTEGNKTTLISYSTKVAYIKDGIAVVNGTYSNTTLRHIKEFLKQNGFKADTKQQILNDYPVVEATPERNPFKMVGIVAQLGNVFGETQEEKNHWKKRMLKAGMKGLTFPSDWDELSEEEKESRLNKVIQEVV